ncbi:MAG: response regulator [Caulobacterales bacterium]|nr:response regulator [Caulobacterales bacterium]
MTEDRIRALLVDDDERLLAAARRVLRRELDLHTACGAESALALLSQSEPFAVIVSDQNMPGMKGADFLAKVAGAHPACVRIMLTGNNDQATAIAAVNAGQVFRFLSKPCSPEEVLEAIRAAGRQYALVTAEKELLERTLSGSVKMLVDVLELSHPSAFARARRVRAWTGRVRSVFDWPRWWEIELAAMLWPLGDLTLPPELIAKRDAGETLSAQEREVMAQGPQAAHDLIANIPRLSGVARIVRHCRSERGGQEGLDAGPEDVPDGARLLRALIDLAQRTNGSDEGLAIAIAALRGAPHLYDPAVLDGLDELAGDGAGAERQVAKELDAGGLLEGDIVARAIHDDSGTLLLAPGSCLTAPMIQKIRLIRQLGKLSAPIQILRALPGSHAAGADGVVTAARSGRAALHA